MCVSIINKIMINNKVAKNNFIERMAKIAYLNSDDKLFLAKLFELKSYKKGTIIDSQGKISKAVYYVNKGILSMEYNKKSKIYIKDFVFKNSPALVYPSFYLSETSRYSIRALTDCEVYKLSKENFEIGKKKIPNLRIIAFKITNLFHKNIEKRFESLITQNPEERYISMIVNHPEIIHAVSLKMIASYLGITDVALSRIRSRIAKRGSISKKMEI
tara:strand:+ start:139 stop:786 length:648 start_codon:yes stop_codon:yes gene_type:complete